MIKQMDLCILAVSLHTFLLFHAHANACAHAVFEPCVWHGKLNSAVLQATVLFPGVACFFLAFCAGAATHILNERHVTQQKQRIDR